MERIERDVTYDLPDKRLYICSESIEDIKSSANMDYTLTKNYNVVHRRNVKIPSWTEIYMGLAFAVSKRSPDAETKHGCFIVDKDNRPVSFGYNGFPRSIDDSDLPNLRPTTPEDAKDITESKYFWMYHSEANAIANAHSQERSVKDCTAYQTGQCCNSCIYLLWQHGITNVVMALRHGTALLKEEDKVWFDAFIKKTGMHISYVTPNLSWLKELGEEVSNPNFYREQVYK